MTPRRSVLVVEDDDAMRLMLEEDLGEAGFEVLTAAGGAEALEQLRARPVDVVVTDLMMPGMKGDELLGRIRAFEPEVPVVITTAFGSIESAVESVKAGAFHYVAKPFRTEQLVATIADALRERDLRRQIVELKTAAHGASGRLVAESPAMRRAVDLALRAAAADSPVLLLGESGTGKEVLARAIHESGPRRTGRFLAINCSAIPDALLESQLFGHRRGAFTDAREDRRGLLVEAQGGTVLLDEIGDMPLGLQAKLLRVLQEREVHPLGAPSPVPVDVRIVAATHRDVPALVRAQRLRQDLYFRLNVISILLPPLRERPEDIVPLVAAFLGKHGGRLGRPAMQLAPQALEALQRYAWPGNVRELENAIERALVLGRGDTIRLEDLPPELAARGPAAAGARAVRSMAEVERDHIQHALRVARGNKSVAARLLRMDRKTLYRKLEAYGIPAR